MSDIYTWGMLLSIFSFAVATAFSPGPNNLMLLSSGLTFGYRKTLGHILGIVVGFPLMVVAVGLGVGGLLEAYPLIYQVLKVVGIAYLFWMAWQIANSKDAGEISHTTKSFTFMQALLFQWVNPKAWIMAVTATTSFTTNSLGVFSQVLVIAFIYLLVGLGSTNSWALGGEFLQRFIHSEQRIRWFNVTMAVLIVLSVVPFVL